MSAALAIAINERVIDEPAILAEMQYHPAADRQGAICEAAWALAMRALLEQAAEAAGLGTGDQAIDRLLAARLQPAPLDEAELRAYYDTEAQRFRSPEMIEAQHILFAADPKDQSAWAAAEERAHQVLTTILAAPDRFEALAQSHSDCPSKAQGGRLGQLQRGDTVPEFETYLFSLAAGELCPQPVASRYGWHIVRLLHREAGRKLPFDHVRAEIAAHLAEINWRRAFRGYVERLLSDARIDDEAGRRRSQGGFTRA